METLQLNSSSRLFVLVARLLLGFAFLAMLLAWLAELMDGDIFGLTQQHFFSDATVLCLLAIGCFLDAAWHAYSEQEYPR